MQGYTVEKTRIRSTSPTPGHHSSPSGHQKPGQTQHKEKRRGSGLQPRQTLPNLAQPNGGRKGCQRAGQSKPNTEHRRTLSDQ
ncbi:hypothetical protein NC651_021716 [Populus alba x Populus x berolinensis]|nr:hypothetical protein NC651_021716 [Populus alba x Populus x berolinensis]